MAIVIVSKSTNQGWGQLHKNVINYNYELLLVLHKYMIYCQIQLVNYSQT